MKQQTKVGFILGGLLVIFIASFALEIMSLSDDEERKYYEKDFLVQNQVRITETCVGERCNTTQQQNQHTLFKTHFVLTENNELSNVTDMLLLLWFNNFFTKIA